METKANQELHNVTYTNAPSSSSLSSSSRSHEAMFNAVHSSSNNSTSGSTHTSLFTTQSSHMHNSKVHIQLVAMSATVGNITELARWFNARLYISDYRPVPLVECVAAETAVYTSAGALIRTLHQSSPLPSVLPNTNKLTHNTHPSTASKVVPTQLTASSSSSSTSLGMSELDRAVWTLCQEGLISGQQVLIFCPTKMACQQTCQLLLQQASLLASQSQSSSVTGSTLDHTSLPTTLTASVTVSASVTAAVPTLTHATVKLSDSELSTQRTHAVEQLKKLEEEQIATSMLSHNYFSSSAATAAVTGTTAAATAAAATTAGIAVNINTTATTIGTQTKTVPVVATSVLDQSISAQLQWFVSAGVAFHHSGLSVEQKRVVERAFKAGVISVLVCTSTLAAGTSVVQYGVVCLVCMKL